MSDLIRSILASTEPSMITDIFSIIMILLFVIALYAKLSNKFENYLDYAPTLLTSLGILGTFTGIVIGLFDFDINNVETSITILLEGLKTAFITSILGITLSLILKVFCQSYQPKRFAKTVITVEHLYNTMCDQLMATESLANSIKENQDNFLATQKEIAEASRSYQHEFIDNQKALAEENRAIELKNQEDFLRNQESYLEKLDNSVTKFAREGVQSLVKDMHEVVKDFNKHVEREFGDNFEKFGQRLDNFGKITNALAEEFTLHEERIQYWTEHCDANVVSLVRVRNELEDVCDLLSNIPNFVESFSTMVEQGQDQISQTTNSLAAYGDISDKINKALPEISSKLSTYSESTQLLDKLVSEDLSEALNNYHSTIRNAQQNVLAPIKEWQSQLDTGIHSLVTSYDKASASMTQQSTMLQEQVSTIQNTVKSLSNIDGDLVNSILTQTISSHRKAMQELAVHQAKTHQEMTQSLSALIHKNHAQSERSMNRHIDNIESHMEREIEAVMQKMGEALALISGQFTQDYHSLISQMQGVLNQQAALDTRQ